MGGVPSQITAAALSTVVILGIQMFNQLGIWRLDSDQFAAVSAFVVAVSNLGFGLLLWYVNRANPNPTAPKG